jgi:hypothetical protein
MVQYILENAYSFGISVTFMVSTLLLSLILLAQSTKREKLERYSMITFGLAFLFFSLAHAVWAYRAAFIPGHPSLYTIFPFWQSFWILFMMGITFIGIWSILSSYPEWFKTRKWILFLIFIPWLIVTLDVLFLSNPAIAEWVCSALITDIRPDIITILVVGLSLTLFVSLALDYYYQQLKGQERRFRAFLIPLGLLLILVGGLFETRFIPICQVITIGRIMMLIGLWLTSSGVLLLPKTGTSVASEVG